MNALLRFRSRLPAPSGGWYVAALLLFLMFPPQVKAQTWMVSTVAQIKLGILDKYGSLGPYKATFTVHNEKTGENFTLVKELEKGQAGVDVLFPSDPADVDYFKNDAGVAAQVKPGNYIWECQVNGKKAVGGHFVFPETGNDVTIIGQR